MLTPRQKYEACRVKSGTALIPFFDTLKIIFAVSTRYGNLRLDYNDGAGGNFTTVKNRDYTDGNTINTLIQHNYSAEFTGDIKVTALQGLRDVYSLAFSIYQDPGNLKTDKLNIQDFGTFIKQFPNLYSYHFNFYAYQTDARKAVIKGDLAAVPDSVERIRIENFEVLNAMDGDAYFNFSSLGVNSKLKYFLFDGVYVGGSLFQSNIKFTGNIANLPQVCTFFKAVKATSNSAITYTAGKVWASSFDTLSIPISLGNFLELDSLYTDMGNSITSAVGDKVISIGGWVTQKSATQRSYLTSLGFTLSGFLDTSTGTASSTTQKFIGDIAQIPSDVTFFKIVQCASGSAITYTSGKAWASSFDTLSIPLALSHTENNAMLADMDGSVSTSTGGKVIENTGYRTGASDAYVSSLNAKGFTVNIPKYTITPQKILDLDFQNNFTDSTGLNTMVAGGTSNQPTFALSGRKPGEYCAVFNGSQSIKTTTNLPINSDKVTVAFWMKTTQTGGAIVAEVSTNYGINNAFLVSINDTLANRVSISDHTTSPNAYNIGNSAVNINNGNWFHVVLTIDRNLGVTQNQIYINGSLSYTQNASFVANLVGNFVNNILFIGQRAGGSIGFNGSLTKLKLYNYPLTAGEVSTLYNSEL